MADTPTPESIAHSFQQVRRTALERDEGWFTSGDGYLAERAQTLRDQLSEHLMRTVPSIARTIDGPQRAVTAARTHLAGATAVQQTVSGATDSLATYRDERAMMMARIPRMSAPDADSQVSIFHTQISRVLTAVEGLRGPQDTDMTGADALALQAQLDKLRGCQDSMGYDLEHERGAITYGRVDEHAARLHGPLSAVASHLDSVVQGRQATLAEAETSLKEKRQRAEILAMAGDPALDGLAEKLEWAAQDPKAFLTADKAGEVDSSPKATPAPTPAPSPQPGAKRGWRLW